MSKRKKQVPTKARIDAVGELARMKPRTAFASVAGLVDAAAVLLEADQPPDVVRALFHCLRLSDDQERRLLVVLDPPPASSGPQASSSDRLPPEASGLRLHPSGDDALLEG